MRLKFYILILLVLMNTSGLQASEIDGARGLYDESKFNIKSSRSLIVVIGHFDLSKTDFSKIGNSDTVPLTFVIDKKIKWVGLNVENLNLSISHKSFDLRNDEGMDRFYKMMLKHRVELSKQEFDFKQGDISGSEFRKFKVNWSKEFKTYTPQLLLYNSIKKGLNFSLEPDVKYALFLSNYYDSEYIRWDYEVSQSLFSLGSGSYADQLLK